MSTFRQDTRTGFRVVIGQWDWDCWQTVPYNGTATPVTEWRHWSRVPVGTLIWTPEGVRSSTSVDVELLQKMEKQLAARENRRMRFWARIDAQT